MKEIISKIKKRNYLKKILHLFDHLIEELCLMPGRIKLRFIDNEKAYIVVIDGGICSQMNQYLAGHYLEMMGYHVMYDLSWYESSGKDMANLQVRNFDLLKLFPQLELNIASKNTLQKYRKYFFYYNIWNHYILSSEQLPKNPRVLGGYGYEFILNKREMFKEVFKLNEDIIHLDLENQKMLAKIREDKEAVGLHVRRGDLAEGSVYLEAVSKDYFIKAVKIFSDKGQIFVFSDDMEWVKQHLVKQLEGHIVLVDINQADRGWCDLLLYSQCRYHIASQGTMGYIGFLMNESQKKKICAPDQPYIRRLLEFNQIKKSEVYLI